MLIIFLLLFFIIKSIIIKLLKINKDYLWLDLLGCYNLFLYLLLLFFTNLVGIIFYLIL